MAVFQSKYRELSFYVDGKRLSFSSGVYSTDDAKVIAVLKDMADVKRVDADEKPKSETEEKVPAPETKPAPKQRKTSAK